MLKLEYDPDADAAYLQVSDGPVARTIDVADDVMADVDADGRLVGVEVLGAGGGSRAALCTWAAARQPADQHPAARSHAVPVGAGLRPVLSVRLGPPVRGGDDL